MNQYFNKNFILSEEEKDLFQKSNSCWICKKLLFLIVIMSAILSSKRIKIFLSLFKL